MPLPQEKRFYKVDGNSMVYESMEHAIGETLMGITYGNYPDYLIVTVYSPVMPDTSCLNPLEFLLESLEEDYGDPEGAASYAPTKGMKDAEKAFINAVLREYEPWEKKEVETVKVDVKEWMSGRADVINFVALTSNTIDMGGKPNG